MTGPNELVPSGKLRFGVVTAPARTSFFVMEQAKASGLVRRAFDDAGFAQLAVAPAEAGT